MIRYWTTIHLERIHTHSGNDSELGDVIPYLEKNQGTTLMSVLIKEFHCKSRNYIRSNKNMILITVITTITIATISKRIERRKGG